MLQFEIFDHFERSPDVPLQRACDGITSIEHRVMPRIAQIATLQDLTG